MARQPGIEPENFSGETWVLRKQDSKRHRVRLVEGAVVSSDIFLPTVSIDRDTAIEEETYRVLSLPPNDMNTAIDRLAMIDNGARARAGIKGMKAKSRLSRQDSAFYLGFVRAVDDVTIRRIQIHSFKIRKKLGEIEKEPSIDNPGYLMDGPLFFYDVDLCKKGSGSDTEYSVEVKQNPWANSCPMTYLKGIPKDLDFVENGIFTEEEWSAYQSCVIDLNAEHRPMAGEELLTFLEEYPLDLDRKDNQNGSDIFIDKARMMEECEACGVAYLCEDAPDTVSVPATPPEENKSLIQRPAKTAEPKLSKNKAIKPKKKLLRKK